MTDTGSLPVPGAQVDVCKILEQADDLAKELERRFRTKIKVGKLCQNDDEFKTWLANWSVSDSLVSKQLSSLSDQREKLDAHRSKGIHRAAVSTQRFVAQLGELSSSYSGLVDAIGDIAGPYGQIASAGFRALSCLFLAATNKSGNETLITSQLEEINRFFPRINTLKAIYKKDTRIGVLVAWIHLDVVCFADKAIRYFSNSWRRALDMFIPPGLKIDPAYESIKTNLVELRAWASLNLHENAEKTRIETEKISQEAASARGQLRELHSQQEQAWTDLIETRQKVVEANQKLEAIHESIQKQEAEKRKQLLRALREDLVIDDSSINFNIELCSQSVLELAGTRPVPYRPDFRSSFMPRDRLERDEAFIKWSANTYRFLLIGGMTNRDLKGVAWTSPAVLELALEWSNSKHGIFAFFTGHAGGFQHRSQRMTFTEMLLGIVLQVARQTPSILQEDTVREATKTLRKDCSNDWRLGDVKLLAKKVGRIFAAASSDRQLCVVVDRLDEVAEAEECYGEMFRCFDLLLTEASNLKILITWSVTEDRKDIERQLEPLSDTMLFNIRLDSGFY